MTPAAAAAFLRRAQRAAGIAGEIGLRLVSDADMRALNRQFRGKDTPTDVLSFPVGAGPVAAGGCLGDIAVSIETANRQARARRHSLDTEIRILLLHGVLHLAGFDHETDQGEMRRKERALRRQLGLPPGLTER